MKLQTIKNGKTIFHKIPIKDYPKKVIFEKIDINSIPDKKVGKANE